MKISKLIIVLIIGQHLLSVSETKSMNEDNTELGSYVEDLNLKKFQKVDAALPRLSRELIKLIVEHVSTLQDNVKRATQNLFDAIGKKRF